MDIRTQISKELVEAKAVLMEALSQKKTGARQAAPGKKSFLKGYGIIWQRKPNEH